MATRVRLVAKKLEQAYRPLAAAYQDPWWETANGQRVLRDLHDACGADSQMHSPGDSHQTAFNDGRRRVWLRILQYQTLSPRELADRVTQNRNEERTAFNYD